MTTNDPNLTWNAEHHYIDLWICVAGRIGVSLLCPSERFRGFEQQFDFKQRYRQFSADFAKLGFDPAGLMLYIGRMFANKDAFIAWVPTESLKTDCKNVPPGMCTGKTSLSTEAYFLTVLFFAHLMKIIQYQDIYVAEAHRYPQLTAESINNATNLL